MSAKYVLRLMFEWGGGCLWCGNDAARYEFDVGPCDDVLPLTQLTQDRLVELSTWHDTALNQNYPPDQSPWSDEERESFEAAANQILQKVREELSDSFEVSYVSLIF